MLFFFVVGAKTSGNDIAVLNGFGTLYKPVDQNEVNSFVEKFLTNHGVHTDDIDMVLLGNNGDSSNDKVFENAASIFNRSISVNFKNLCGEYPTASAFALWYATNILSNGTTAAAGRHLDDKKIKNILIWNHYLGIHHTLFLVSAC